MILQIDLHLKIRQNIAILILKKYVKKSIIYIFFIFILEIKLLRNIYDKYSVLILFLSLVHNPNEIMQS